MNIKDQENQQIFTFEKLLKNESHFLLINETIN